MDDRLLIPAFEIRCSQIAEMTEMESPLAQDSLVEAQEDSTSVEPEDSASLPDATTAATTTTTPTTTTKSADTSAVRRLSVEREDLVMVCERLEERTDGEVVEGQSSDNLSSSRESQAQAEVDMGLRMGNETVKGEEEAKDMAGSLRDPSSGDEVSSSTSESTDQREDQPTRVGDITGTSRKRPASSDFLPIGAEMKKIGVEISEEEAMQLRNDVRRLSPVLVSLRERTLGEVSLTSESCLFGDETTSRSNVLVEKTPTQDATRTRGADDDEEETVGIAPLIAECTSSDTQEDTQDCVEKMDCQEQTLDVEVTSASSKCDGFRTTTLSSAENMDVEDAETADVMSAFTKDCAEMATSQTVSSRPASRQLMVMLTQINQVGGKVHENEAWSCVSEESSPRPGMRTNSVDEEEREEGEIEDDDDDELEKTSEECRPPVSSEDSKNQQKSWQSDSCPLSARSRRCEPTESTPSPRYPAMKTCTVVLERIGQVRRPEQEDSESTRKLSEKEEPAAPVEVIGKLGENEEVVLASSSLCGENNRLANELDSSETVPSSPEETAEETSADVAEGVDTETETETGSDSSEVSAMTTNIRLRDVDVPSDQLPCAEGVPPLCCVKMAPIMTRLEAERPEPYTEDSAESLALATGARDEVRSDGSDSGLGSEIPGDSGPAPAPESDSETSFLDRIPDDILSDKEKGNADPCSHRDSVTVSRL